MQETMESVPTGSDATSENAETAAESTTEIQSAEQPSAAPETEESLTFENPIEDPAIFQTEENVVEEATKKIDEEREQPKNPEDEVPEEIRWKRAYEEEGVEQWNRFQEENPEKVEKYREEKEKWYEKARAKAEQVMQELDPAYTVEVQNSIVSPDDNDKAEYRTVTLAFESPQGPATSWTMEIEPSDDYIQNRLPDVIKKVYEERQTETRTEQDREKGERNVAGIQNVKFDFFPTGDEKYIAQEMDRLAQLEEIKQGLSVESGDDTELIQKIMSHFNQPKRFIMARGTMSQRTIEITPNHGTVTIAETDVRGSQRSWGLDSNGKMIDGSAPADGLKNLLKEFAGQIRTRAPQGKVNARAVE